MFFNIIGIVDDAVWSYVAPFLVLAFGLFASIRLKCPQIRFFKRMFTNLKAKAHGEGASPFATVCVSLGAQVGTGNVVGVATAIASGGPGALFWMWITAILGMATSLCETVLSQLYKRKNRDGTWRGGAAYYIEDGMHSKFLAVFIAIFLAIGGGAGDCMGHVNGIYNSINAILPCNPWILGGIISLTAGIIVYGGFKRASKFSEAVVPFMAIGYLLVSIVVLVLNIKALPGVFGLVFQSAFSAKSVVGGVVGYSVAEAFRYGMARGIFSNEAGLGTTCNINGSSSAGHPVTQGILGMFAVFVDTILVCSATGLTILLSGAYAGSEGGAVLTQAAFGTFFGDNFARIFVAVVLFFFAFTSIVGSYYCGRVAIQYLFGDKQKILVAYLIFEVVVSTLGAVFEPENVFLVIDLTNGMMIIPNIIACFYLFKKSRSVIDDYTGQLKQGILEPTYDWNKFRKENNLEPVDD